MSGGPYYLPVDIGSLTGWMCECNSTFRREREFARHKCQQKQGPWLMSKAYDHLRLRRMGAIFKDGGPRFISTKVAGTVDATKGTGKSPFFNHRDCPGQPKVPLALARRARGEGERVDPCGRENEEAAKKALGCSDDQHPTDVRKLLSGSVGGRGEALIPREREKETAAATKKVGAAKKTVGCSDRPDPIDAPQPIGTEAKTKETPRSSSPASCRADSFVDGEGWLSSSGTRKRESSSSSSPCYRTSNRYFGNVGGGEERVASGEGEETVATMKKTLSCSDDQHPVDAPLPTEVGQTDALGPAASGDLAAMPLGSASPGFSPPSPRRSQESPRTIQGPSSLAGRRADCSVGEERRESSSSILKRRSSSSSFYPMGKRSSGNVGGGGQRVVSGESEKELVGTVKKTVSCSDDRHAVDAPLPTERGQTDALGPAASGDRAAMPLGSASPVFSPPSPRPSQRSPRTRQGPSSSASRRTDPFVDGDWWEGWKGRGPLSGKLKRRVASSLSPSPTPSSQPCPRRMPSSVNNIGRVGEGLILGERGEGRIAVGTGGVRTTASPTNTATNTATAANTATTATASRRNSSLAGVGSAVPATGRVTAPSAAITRRREIIASDMTAYQIFEVIKRVVDKRDMPALFGHVLCSQPEHVQSFFSAERSAAARHPLSPDPSTPARRTTQTSPPPWPPTSSNSPAACPAIVAIKAEPASATEPGVPDVGEEIGEDHVTVSIAL